MIWFEFVSDSDGSLCLNPSMRRHVEQTYNMKQSLTQHLAFISYEQKINNVVGHSDFGFVTTSKAYLPQWNLELR